MIYLVKWTESAKNTYLEEINFIYHKWSDKEVENFEDLVKSELNRLSFAPELGKLRCANEYSLVISKQTTIFYRINSVDNSIELLLFWNNLKNPDDLSKLL